MHIMYAIKFFFFAPVQINCNARGKERNCGLQTYRATAAVDFCSCFFSARHGLFFLQIKVHYINSYDVLQRKRKWRKNREKKIGGNSLGEEMGKDVNVDYYTCFVGGKNIERLENYEIFVVFANDENTRVKLCVSKMM